MAQRAGRYAAITATVASTRTTPAKVNGSFGLTPNKTLAISRDAANARSSPAAKPVPTIRKACLAR